MQKSSKKPESSWRTPKSADEQITVSEVVSKLRNGSVVIPSFSLMPGITCNPEACKVCFKDCYAAHYCKYRKGVVASYEKNTRIAMDRMGDFEKQMCGYLEWHSPKYFRIHTSGDFFSKKYFLAWCRIAKKYPKVRFLAFTKQWNMIVRKAIPKNLTVIMSEWVGVDMPEWLKRYYPTSIVLPRKDVEAGMIPEESIPCTGNCATCTGCWRLKPGQSVALPKH